MNVIDLFSGIGGFSLGLERAGMRTIAFCELNDHCLTVLHRHWPTTPVYWDATRDSGVPMPGSVPRGAPEGALRLTELFDVRPDWIVIENTYHRWRAWVPELRRILWTFGYASVCFRVRAAEVGARHARARAFVIAHADSEQLRELSRWWDGPGGEVAQELAKSWDSAPGAVGAPYGLSDGVERLHTLGNAVCPYVSELIGRGINAVTSTPSQT